MTIRALFWTGRMGLAAVALLAGTAVGAVPDEARLGARLFADSSYKEAADAFRQATIAAPDDMRWRYDLGLAEALGQDYESALNHLGQSASGAAPEVAGASHYNAGNVHMAMNNFAEAAGAYRQALVRNPGDVDAKHNLELALRSLQQQQEQPSGSQNDSTQNEKQEQEDSKQQDQKQQDQKQDQEKQEEGEKNPEESKQDQPQDSTGQEPPPDPSEAPPTDSTLSREQAERILRALADEEARLRDQAKKVMGIPAPGGKDW